MRGPSLKLLSKAALKVQATAVLGATQFEFVATVLIVALLLMVVLPKFQDTTEDAHEVTVLYTGQSLHTAVHLAHLQWIAMGKPKSVDAITGFGEEDIATSDAGWPTDAKRALESSHSPVISDDLPRCRRLWRALLATTSDTPLGERTLSVWESYDITAPNLTTCRYRYEVGSYEGYIDYNLAKGTVITNAGDKRAW